MKKNNLGSTAWSPKTLANEDVTGLRGTQTTGQEASARHSGHC